MILLEKPVLIIGGGLAGLACARELHRHGRRFELFESADALGGRVRTDEVDGFRLDRGFQVLLTDYPEARRELDYERLQLRPFHPGALVRIDGAFHRVGDPFRRPQDLWSTLAAPVGSWADKMRMVHLRRALQDMPREHVPVGDDRSTLVWLQEFGFSDQIIERFFKPFLGGVFLDGKLETSSRLFRYLFPFFGAGDSAIPTGGMQAIPRQLAELLPSDCIHLNSPVAEVNDRSVVLADGYQVDGESVVIATGADVARKWIPYLPKTKWHGTTCLYFDVPQPPVNDPVLVLNGEGRGPINNLHVASRVDSTLAPKGRHLVSVTSIGTADPASIEDEVKAQLREWFGPAFNEWRLLKTYVIPQALPAQSSGVLNPPERPVKLSPGLFVCGDHVDNGSINGALRSGRRAAESCLTAESRRPFQAMA